MSHPLITRRDAVALISAFCLSSLPRANAFGTSVIDSQPYFASVKRALDTLARLGAPIAAGDAQRISALELDGSADAVQNADSLLDAYTLARLCLQDDASLSIEGGGARRLLVEQGWRLFLIRVDNSPGTATSIWFSNALESPAQMSRDSSLFRVAQRADLMDTLNKAPLIGEMWLLSEMHGAVRAALGERTMPLVRLSGIRREYHVIQLFSRDRGMRAAELSLAIPNEEGWWWFWQRATKQFTFECMPTREVKLSVLDTDGRGCVASLTIKDSQGHVYPPQAMRLAPDMFFHEQIYRADGEMVRLPDGEYVVECSRGPEYLRGRQSVRIGASVDRIEINLKRWIEPSRWGWYSGDTHIHAAGCAHYQVPTEGVSPETMIRHVRGEGLAVSQVLTWGPSWYYQKQFFKGRAESPAARLEHPQLQAANNSTWQPHGTPKDNESLLRYDVEVSGFPSSLFGHLVLLRLKEQDYPDTKIIEDWPSWNLPILRWARAQGAVIGYAHCGVGMVVGSVDLPNYEIPPFDSIGTNEAIVDVTHGFLDFLSGCNFFPLAELNAWYHMLNCGFRVAMVGETDYPCVTGERPGVGRTYVHMDRRPLGDAGYDDWIEGVQHGRLYCGDGRSHFLEFMVEGRSSGDVVSLSAAGAVTVHAVVAARLDPEPFLDREVLGAGALRRWHLENSRIAKSRAVAVELVVNGVAADKVTIIADGVPRKIKFRTHLLHSSWLGLRILTSAHTHPVFVHVYGRPIRASKRSAKWCLSCVDKLWKVKSPFLRENERAAAAKAFDHAREVYEKIQQECELD